MFLPVKQLLRISTKMYGRKYCINKLPPPGMNPNNAARTPWTPYEQALGDRKSDFIEDVMEFRETDNKPVQRRKGKQSLYFKIIEKFNRTFRHGYTLKQKIESVRRFKLAEDQLYDADRVRTLGPDLAVAHFICARGGGVKFVGKEGFVQPGKNKAHLVLPSYPDDTYKVEAINAVNYNLVYEGLLQFSELKHLRWISLKGNTDFDNWCMDRLSLVAPDLEFINLTGCRKIDHNAFGCFYRFKNLKCVVVEDTNQTDLFKLTCLTLESEHPDLVFVGLILKKPIKSVFNT